MITLSNSNHQVNYPHKPIETKMEDSSRVLYSDNNTKYICE